MSKNFFTAFLLAAPVALATASCASLLDVDFGAAKPYQDASTGSDACVAKSCQAQGFECGTQNDTCGEALECGTCKTGVCKAGKCACVPKTCPDLKVQCGKVDDGCGALLDCGGCVNPNDACDAQTNACACKPKDCKAQNAECGSVPDGCGNQYACGTCVNNPNGPNCTNGKCGQAACVPKTCLGEKKNCGQISDGCGKILDCGNCTLPQSCGGAGVVNVCGCTAKTCLQLGKNCGTVGDGCGGNLNCGTCVAPQTCNGGGTANVCGCTPSGACKVGTNCGTVPDNCGGNISCGPPCVTPNTCGGGGVPYQCGCTPKTCLDVVCGNNLPNGCGGVINCGLCGGGGCFVASTSVLMADGTSKPIDSIRHGDVVLSADPVTGQPMPKPVDGVAVHGPEDSADGLVVINGTVHSTRNHPFWVDGQSVRADQLHVGQMLRVVTVDGGHPSVHSVAVTSVVTEPGSVTTYDLKFRQPGGYFVGDTHTLAQPKQ